MKIVIIGPGAAPIPPTGWGAVEILVHGLRCALEDEGHEVHIVNTPDKHEIILQTNSLNPDFVHIHYEDHINVAPHLNCDTIAATAHNAYLDQPERWINDVSYSRIVHSFATAGVNVFALSQPAADAFLLAGVDPKKIRVVYNGTIGDNFRFSEACEYPDMSLYLAKIDFRKRQHLFQGIPGLFFAGNIADDRFKQDVNYLGEWSKNELHENLTKFANLVLLSDGECHSLALLEGLSAGLGLVISEFACSNLDLSKPFIDVIPESKIRDKEYIHQIIKKNAEISVKMRADIKEYSKKFLWKNVVRDVYLPAVDAVMKKDKVDRDED